MNMKATINNCFPVLVYSNKTNKKSRMNTFKCFSTFCVQSTKYLTDFDKIFKSDLKRHIDGVVFLFGNIFWLIIILNLNGSQDITESSSDFNQFTEVQRWIADTTELSELPIPVRWGNSCFYMWNQNLKNCSNYSKSIIRNTVGESTVAIKTLPTNSRVRSSRITGRTGEEETRGRRLEIPLDLKVGFVYFYRYQKWFQRRKRSKTSNGSEWSWAFICSACQQLASECGQSTSWVSPRKTLREISSKTSSVICQLSNSTKTESSLRSTTTKNSFKSHRTRSSCRIRLSRHMSSPSTR